jgi:hypothetical protein
MKNEMLAKKQMVSKEAEPKAKGAKAIATWTYSPTCLKVKL